jgi:transposase-like protein
MATYSKSAKRSKSSAAKRKPPPRVITTQDQAKFTQFLTEQGHQRLEPMLQLVEQSKLAADELITAMGKAAIEALLQLSAQELAGPKQQGQRGMDRPIYHHGTQDGVVELAERKVKVKRPRLRKREGGASAEVPIPAYEAMQDKGQLGPRMLQILLDGVSTRGYEQVLPRMADSLGISKSAVSRQIIEEGEKQLKDLMDRRFDDKDILIIWIDGIQFAGHHILAAVGVDVDGYKYVLGISQGAAENSVTVTTLLESMVERGIKPDRRRLFVIDGSKALRAGIDRVYGSNNPVQRCRNHKLRNVVSHLPQEQQDQARSAMRAAWKLPADQGMARLEQLAKWYDKDQPGAAGSLREGLAEMFTVNLLGLPKELCRCLSNTNLIDSGHSAVRRATGRVTRWRDGSMALRWAACGFVIAEKRFNKIQGCEKLWILDTHLKDELVEKRKAG